MPFNAFENPFEGFRPFSRKSNILHQPVGGMGVRIESASIQGINPPFYDSPLTKLISAHGKTREE